MKRVCDNDFGKPLHFWKSPTDPTEEAAEIVNEHPD